MICFPNAKINLGLDVVEKRADGYHNLETVFYPIGLKDALEIVPTEADAPYRLFQYGTSVDSAADDNLVLKALKLMRQEVEIPPIEIHLFKKIPFGAGLGGGSSDAAFMLKLLNDTFHLNFTDDRLQQFAARLGADCPFFIENKPIFATGIGDQFQSIELDLSRYHFVLVKPLFGVATKDAYAMLTPEYPELSLKEIVKKPVTEWRKYMKNDFETPVFNKYPEIRAIKEKLYELGAVYASMSGSGSSVYALFDAALHIENQFNNCFIWQSETSL